MSPRVSVVIPVFNEAGNIGPLLRRLAPVLAGLAEPFEIIIVNDGSTDETSAEIAAATVAGCRELRLPHAGQASALLAGLRAAQGDMLITLDGDGQNDPADIPTLFTPVASGGFDLVCGRRIDRRGSGLRRVMSRVGNGLRRAVLRDGVHDAGCQLRVFRREVVGALVPMELMQSFVPALAVAAGFRVAEVPVRDHPRAHGASKYGLRRLWLRPAVAMLALRFRLWRDPPIRRNADPR